MQKGEIMNQQEIDRLWLEHSDELHGAPFMDKHHFTAAIQEAVAQARRQALEEVKELTSKERPIGDFSYWTTGYNCAMWTIKEHCNDAISALMEHQENDQ